MHGVHEEKVSFAGYFAELLQTKEVKNAVDSGITEVINLWGEGSTARKFASKPAKWMIKKSLSSDNGHGEELLELLKQPDFLEHASSILPVILKNIGEVIHSMVVSLESQPPDKQLEMLSRFFNAVSSEKTGEIITSLSRTADSLHKNNPTLIADTLLPALGRFMGSTDFSELKSLFDNSETDIRKIMDGVNDLAFAYPAKFVTLLSFLPGLSNHVIYYTGDLLKRFNDLPADILTDILISFFKEVDGKTVGRFLNNTSELIRQVHTGSALIGEAGVPQFSTELMRKSKEVFNETDPVVFAKAVNAVKDGKEVFTKTFQTIVSEHPEFFLASLEEIANEKNSKIRLLKHKLDLIEDLDEEEAATAISNGMSKLNAYDLAELVNSFCALLNSINDYSPGYLEKIGVEFAAAVDTDELQTCLSAVTADTVKGLRPVIRTAAPILIKEIISSLENSDNDELINGAKESLRQFILGKEA